MSGLLISDTGTKTGGSNRASQGVSFAVLVLAGALKRVDQEVSEELIMYRTMLDLIKPKLVYLDLPLFMALLSDLFPGVEQPPTPAGALRNAIEADLVDNNLQVLLHAACQRAWLADVIHSLSVISISA